jgi:hypothetical protein
MMNKQSDRTLLSCLEGKQLASVTFVRDYLQLGFDGPVFSAYVWPVVHVSGISYSISAPGYRDEICKRISRNVISADEIERKELVFNFDDGSSFVVSLRSEEREGPEAAMLQSNSELGWIVW